MFSKLIGRKTATVFIIGLLPISMQAYSFGLGVNIDKKNEASVKKENVDSSKKYPVIPEEVTSFGAAISNGSLYIYGGHSGSAHSYNRVEQAKTLRRLDLKNPKAWESLGEGPGLQGLAMVAHQNKLYRIGGFTAKNKEGEDHDLWSQAEVSCYDLATKKWSKIAPLPEPRSSFDAAVLGDKIYVIGGWQLQGEKETSWHKTAYVMDRSVKTPKWQALPQPPFIRRALAVAAHDGKIYVIGGMQVKGGPCTKVDIYDPKTNKWTQGPNLPGKKGMEGFGCSSFAVGNRLFVSTISGKLQQLSKDGKSWKTVKELKRARFFHRMLPLSGKQLLSVGGASMKVGKFKEVDVIEVP